MLWAQLLYIDTTYGGSRLGGAGGQRCAALRNSKSISIGFCCPSAANAVLLRAQPQAAYLKREERTAALPGPEPARLPHAPEDADADADAAADGEPPAA